MWLLWVGTGINFRFNPYKIINIQLISGNKSLKEIRFNLSLLFWYRCQNSNFFCILWLVRYIMIFFSWAFTQKPLRWNSFPNFVCVNCLKRFKDTICGRAYSNNSDNSEFLKSFFDLFPSYFSLRTKYCFKSKFMQYRINIFYRIWAQPQKCSKSDLSFLHQSS